MGHRRLGEMPATRNWQKVVALLKVTDDPTKIAFITGQAANRGLELAKNDKGVAQAIYMLMNLVWSATKSDFRGEIANMGMSVPQKASLLDVVGSFDESLDKTLRRAGHRTDLAEIARISAVETLSDLCRKETGSLFGVTTKETQEALKSYATPKQFGVVGQNFFGKFLYRFLDYHLSRELPKHIGSNKQFKNIDECGKFKQALALHCHQTSRIVKEFSGCWPSATEFKEGLSVENVRTKFVPVAFKKIKSELKQRDGENG